MLEAENLKHKHKQTKKEKRCRKRETKQCHGIKCSLKKEKRKAKMAKQLGILAHPIKISVLLNILCV